MTAAKALASSDGDAGVLTVRASPERHGWTENVKFY
jgi:hypothetical protein